MELNIGDLIESENNVGIIINIQYELRNSIKIKWIDFPNSYSINQLLTYLKGKNALWKHHPIKKTNQCLNTSNLFLL